MCVIMGALSVVFGLPHVPSRNRRKLLTPSGKDRHVETIITGANNGFDSLVESQVFPFVRDVFVVLSICAIVTFVIAKLNANAAIALVTGVNNFIDWKEQATTITSHAQLRDRNTQTARLDQKLIAAKNQAAPTAKELWEKLRQAQKQIFGLRWQTTKREKDGQRFSSLRFGHYLRKIVLP
jgi:hypothetical protein